jgi:hypothetical protein
MPIVKPELVRYKPVLFYAVQTSPYSAFFVLHMNESQSITVCDFNGQFRRNKTDLLHYLQSAQRAVDGYIPGDQLPRYRMESGTDIDTLMTLGELSSWASRLSLGFKGYRAFTARSKYGKKSAARS